MNASWTAYLPEVLRDWLDGRHGLQNAIGNTGWLLFDRVIRMAIGLTVGAWVARYLGPGQFGELAYILSFIAFFQIVADLQADGFIIRDIAQGHATAGEVLGTALWLRLGVGLCSWIAAVAFMALMHPGEPRLILLTAVVGATLVFQAADTVDYWFQSQSQSKRTVLAKLVSYLVSNGVKVMLLIWKAPLVAFAAVLSLECAALALALALAYRSFPTREYWRASKEEAQRLLGLCWPFLASGLMVTAYMRIDQIMLKEMLGERELGIYAAALPLAQVWNVVPATLVTSLAPYVARKKSRGDAEYRDALVVIFRFFALASLVGAVLTALASPWIIGLLYGVQYRASAPVLSTLVFVIIFGFQGMAQSLWVINDNLRTVNLVSTFLAATISIACNALLIRHYGVLGAVYSCLLAQAASVVLIPCLLRRDLRVLYGRAFLGLGKS
jgi:O-antigen/teichoic acid export membrane protein